MNSLMNSSASARQPVAVGARPTDQRRLPHNPDAERAVLGSLIRDNRCIDDVLLLLHADDLYNDAHQKIFRCIADNWNGRKPVDLVLLADDLKRRGQLEDIGGPAYLASLWDAAPTAYNVTHYAEAVRETACQRALIYLAGEILRDAYEQAPAGDLLDRLGQSVYGMSDRHFHGAVESLGTTLTDALERIMARKDGTLAAGVATGLADLDELTAGLQASELTIIGARPSQGKTSLAISIAHHAVTRLKVPTLFFTLEMSRLELAERLLLCQTKLDSHKLRTGRFSPAEAETLIHASNLLHKAPLFLDDTACMTAQRVTSLTRQHRLKHKIGLVVVDYVQIMEPENRRANRYEQIGEVTRRLKILAKDLKIPVVALAQVGRGAEDHPKPRLSDLRESGDLENHADGVFLLHRPTPWINDTPPVNEAIEVIVAKQRNGRTGSVTVNFHRPSMTFGNAARGGDAAAGDPFPIPA